MLCDHILFWAQHRERPAIIPGSFDDEMFLLTFAMNFVWFEIAKKMLGEGQNAFALFKEGLDRYIGEIKNGKSGI